MTAIVACIALLTAALNGFDAVALANERSASQPELVSWRGIEVNHQFSKSLRAERCCARPAAEAGGAVELFSLLRPASELAIARAFAGMAQYHGAFTSCNAVFRIDPGCAPVVVLRLPEVPLRVPRAGAVQRAAGHGGDLRPATCSTRTTSSRASRCSPRRGGHKPFECVGEESESLAAMRCSPQRPALARRTRSSRAAPPRCCAGPPVRRDLAAVLALSDEHDVPGRR